MRKLWFTVFISIGVIGSLLLTACSQAKPPASPTTEKPVATEDNSAAKMDCQVVSMTPAQGPTEVSMFPPPSDADWVLGKNPKAALTLTEYSDFQ